MQRVRRQGSGKPGDARDEGSPGLGVGYSFLELLRVCNANERIITRPTFPPFFLLLLLAI